MERVTSSFFSLGWYGSVLAPSMMGEQRYFGAASSFSSSFAASAL